MNRNFFCHHNSLEKSHFKLSKNDPVFICKGGWLIEKRVGGTEILKRGKLGQGVSALKRRGLNPTHELCLVTYIFIYLTFLKMSYVNQANISTLECLLFEENFKTTFSKDRNYIHFPS